MDAFVIYFSGGKAALDAYLLAQHGVKLDELASEKVDNVNAEFEIGERKIITFQPEGSNWHVLTGDIELVFDEEKTGRSLAVASKGGEALMIFDQDVTGAAWFEYHKDGQLRRKWAEIESEVEANIGEPLNEYDAKMFTDEVDEEEGPPGIWELEELAQAVTGIAWERFSAPGVMYRMPPEDEED